MRKTWPNNMAAVQGANHTATNAHPIAVRQYEIRGTKYIVRATVKDEANEDAVDKVRRLIRNEVNRSILAEN